MTGNFNKPKESFTGAVVAVTKDDIKANYSRNVLQTLANIDPSLRIVQNNAMGSDPNTLPPSLLVISFYGVQPSHCAAC